MPASNFPYSEKRQGRRARSGAGAACPERADGSALGIYAKNSSARQNGPQIGWSLVDEDTGEVAPFVEAGRASKPHVDPLQARIERFALKSVVNRILPTSRTSKCHRWRVPNRDLQVMQSPDHGKAFYAGLEVCASVWACPVCAAKISERRRAELQGAIATAKAKGWHVYLLTLTVPHGLGDDIRQMLDQMGAAWRKLSSDRSGRALVAGIGLQGTIRALEVTDGPNGFHPHYHVLLFTELYHEPLSLQERYCPLWQKACKAVGLPVPSEEHGCRVDDGSEAGAYAAKWGLESEMTKGHAKQGREGSRTPFDLLRAVLRSECDWSRRRFVVYAEAFKGRRQLHWSVGLRAKLAVEDTTDDELIAKEEAEADILAELTDDQWRAILVTRSEAALLTVAEKTPQEIPAFLAGVVAVAKIATGGQGSARETAKRRTALDPQPTQECYRRGEQQKAAPPASRRAAGFGAAPRRLPNS